METLAPQPAVQHAWKELTIGQSRVILRPANDFLRYFPFFPAFYAILYAVDGIRPSAVHAGGKVAQYVVGRCVASHL